MKTNRWLVALIAPMLLAVLLPAWGRADYHRERTLKLEPGGRFVIESSSGSVTITGASQSGAHIEITSNRSDLENLFDISYQENPGEARVIVRKKYEHMWEHNLQLHFDVQVPAETSVEVKTGGGSVKISDLRRDADLSTAGGSIKVSDLTANLKAHTSGGSIDLRQITGNAHVDTSGGAIQGDSIGGRLDARTSGGPITLDDIKGDLLAHTSGGSIRISNAGGKVDANTSGGSVEVAFAQGNSRGGIVETSGGGVRVALDPHVNLTLDASTSSGPVRTTGVPIQVLGTISPSHIHGTIGSGGETLRLHSDGGSIHIEAR